MSSACAIFVAVTDIIAVEHIDVIVDGLYKGNLGRPLIALLVHGGHKTFVQAVLVGVDDASVRQRAAALSLDGAAFKASVQVSVVVVATSSASTRSCLCFAIEFAVKERQFPSLFFKGNDFGIRKPDGFRFLGRDTFKGCDVNHLIESNRLFGFVSVVSRRTGALLL